MPIQHAIRPRSAEIMPGLTVRRSLPAMASRTVGPFVFFDHFGPVELAAGEVHDVLPHPHIGLATVTYLLEGALIHRDSLGTVQRIEPGALNWMTAGSGIVHSERTPPELHNTVRKSHGLQLWVGLPSESEETEPSFQHAAAESIPRWSDGATHLRVLVGAFDGLRSPVSTFSPTQYLDVSTHGARFSLPADFGDGPAERAVYVLDGALEIDGDALPTGTLAVLEPGRDATIEAPAKTRYVIVGGAPLDSYRFMWWNFVSSRKDRIEQARRDWAAMAMGTIPDDREEFVPLPAR